jgi:hypothetical protein
MLKKMYIEPSTKATTAICTTVARCMASVTTRDSTAAMRTTSQTIITRLRFDRSATTPAAKPNSAHGTMRAKPTIPACAGDPVTASTSSG